MLIIGSHVSFDKDEQLLKSAKEAASYNSNTFMFYTGAPQNTKRANINKEKLEEAIEFMKNNNIDYSKVIVHAPYIINLANNIDLDKYNFSINFLKEEVKRCSELGAKYLVLHPGSHVGLGIDVGIENIKNALNEVLNTDKSDVKILLETMAGKGSEVGSKIEEIQQIIDGVVKKERIGVCLDTCHLNDAGYDIENFDNLLDLIEEKIGLSKVYCIHINDSKNTKESHKDRHENFGLGTIGFNTLLNIIYNERVKEVPKILETPYIEHEFAPYKQEIQMIRNKKFDPNLINKIKNKEDVN